MSSMPGSTTTRYRTFWKWRRLSLFLLPLLLSVVFLTARDSEAQHTNSEPPFVGAWTCNDYFPYVPALGGCWGVSEETWLTDATRGAAEYQANLGHRNGYEVTVHLDVWENDCFGTRWSYRGALIHDPNGRIGDPPWKFLWSTAHPPVVVASISRNNPGCGCSVRNVGLTALTTTGEVQSLTPLRGSLLNRQTTAEDGGAIVSDEFAILTVDRNELTMSYATSGLSNPSHEALPVDEMSKETSLLIQHQAQHPDNANFAHVPTVTFISQPVFRSAPDGTTGFAVVEIGESGTALRATLLSVAGPFRNSALEAAILKGVRSTYPDDRRHDHRAYLSFKVAGGVVHLIGDPFVALPMCCRPPCDPTSGNPCEGG
jgi:hypothetical protein